VAFCSFSEILKIGIVQNLKITKLLIRKNVKKGSKISSFIVGA
jgi:hypothetical protein